MKTTGLEQDLSRIPLFIGMPVFNCECYIEQALTSIRNQSLANWRLVVADNCSTDRTGEIVQAIAKADPRISYRRHNLNIGAVDNFLFLANEASEKYFMWAAADDEWSENFLEECVRELDTSKNVAFAGGTVLNIDSDGNPVRTYGSFAAYQVDDRTLRLKAFLRSLEIDGKANMIYSVYRTEFCRDLCRISKILEGWGSDMAFVFAALARGNYSYLSGIALRKRIIDASGLQTASTISEGRYSDIQFGGSFPPTHFHQYFFALLRAAPDFATKLLVCSVMLPRFLRLMR